MDHLPNIFKDFSNLSRLDIAFVQSRLPFSMAPNDLANYISNRLVFPNAIPQTHPEYLLELAILSGIVAINSGYFYNQTLSQITIPLEYTQVYQNLNDLVRVVVTSVGLHGQVSVTIPNQTGHSTTGSAIAFESNDQDLQISSGSQKFTLTPHNFLYLPPSSSTEVTINQTSYRLNPGELGTYILSI